MSIELWTEKYRPKTLDEYVWRDAAQRNKVEEWMKEGALPHLLFSGASGTGKTSLAYLMLSMMGIPSGDILKIPASRERKVDVIQDRIISFVGTWAFNPTGIKYVILDEADAISPLAQKMLRTEMETYADTCRFILTCNYPSKIIPAIHGRCQSFHFDALDQEQFLVRLMSVLDSENVQYEDEAIGAIMEMQYPNMRKAINVAQQSVVGGVLQTPTKEEAGTKDYLIEMVSLFQAGRTTEARKLIVSQAQPEEYVDIYRFFYTNLELWGETEDQKDDALLAIRRGLVNHALVADPEINLSATLAELCRIMKQ